MQYIMQSVSEVVSFLSAASVRTFKDIFCRYWMLMFLLSYEPQDLWNCKDIDTRGNTAMDSDGILASS